MIDNHPPQTSQHGTLLPNEAPTDLLAAACIFCNGWVPTPERIPAYLELCTLLRRAAREADPDLAPWEDQQVADPHPQDRLTVPAPD